jgi:hypothetical protein
MYIHVQKVTDMTNISEEEFGYERDPSGMIRVGVTREIKFGM